jgi:hypothetical protein
MMAYIGVAPDQSRIFHPSKCSVGVVGIAILNILPSKTQFELDKDRLELPDRISPAERFVR